MKMNVRDRGRRKRGQGAGVATHWTGRTPDREALMRRKTMYTKGPTRLRYTASIRQGT